MATWYRIERYGKPSIVPVKVVKETTEFVTLIEKWGSRESETRQRKGSEFHPTFEAAKAHMLDTTKRAIEYNRDEHIQLLSRLSDIEKLEDSHE